MSSVVIAGNTSGSITLSAPATAGSNTITLPAETGTLVTTATSTGISGSAITTGTVGVSVGGTGRTTNVAYSVVCGGTTTGGAEQSVASVGTSGQVLTSGGAGALPTWTTISSSPTTAQVQTAMAGSAAGDLGTYMWGLGGGGWNFGSNYAGSSISAAGHTTSSLSGGGYVQYPIGSTQSGTWKAMGQIQNTNTYQLTLFLRVA
jgi:hypothetical protein